jgi:hypothetical protein
MSRIRDIANILSGVSTDMATDAEVTSSIASHAAAADPHTGYLKESEFNAAGKNLIYNSGFDIAQRGTNITTGGYAYGLDRWNGFFNTGYSHQRVASTVPGSAYAARIQRANGTSNTNGMNFEQPFSSEDIVKILGKQLVLSFWARAGSGSTMSQIGVYFFGGTGSPRPRSFSAYTNETDYVSQAVNLTTTWTKYTYVLNNTIATNTTQASLFFAGYPSGTAGANDWYEITQVQLEFGTAATAYSSMGGHYQAELAACQRYYYKASNTATNYPFLGNYIAQTSSLAVGQVMIPVPMRLGSTSLSVGLQSAGGYRLTNNANYTASSIAYDTTYIYAAQNSVPIVVGSSGLTPGAMYFLVGNFNSNASIEISAEL